MIRVLLVAVALCASTARAEERGFQLLDSGVPTPAPLVVALHCYGCSPEELPRQLGLEALAKKHGFVAAIPIGRRNSHGASFWNATDACCDFDRTKPDDIGYVTHIIDELVRKGVADPKRIYLIGFSNGGFLAHRLACDQAPKIAAIVSIGGAGPSSCKPSARVSVLDIHGHDDDVVPGAGGKLGSGLPQRARFPSARKTVGGWARVDHCEGAGERWSCPSNALEVREIPGGHWPRTGPDFGEQLWQWLAAQHK